MKRYRVFVLTTHELLLPLAGDEQESYLLFAAAQTVSQVHKALRFTKFNRVQRHFNEGISSIQNALGINDFVTMVEAYAETERLPSLTAVILATMNARVEGVSEGEIIAFVKQCFQVPQA